MLKKYRGMDEITLSGRAVWTGAQALYCLIRTPPRSELQLDVCGSKTEAID
jgi:hypothetical protein